MCKLFLVKPAGVTAHIAGGKTLKGAELVTAKLIPTAHGTDTGNCDAVISKTESKAGGLQNATVPYFAQLWDAWYQKYKDAKSD